MVAYSFNARFEAPIRAGLEFIPLAADFKRHTIRAERRRHARPGELVQLYVGMRTRHCRLLGVAVCTWVAPIYMRLLPVGKGGMVEVMRTEASYMGQTAEELDMFARADGFRGWADLLTFWAKKYPDQTGFAGVLINWEPRPVQEVEG